jgi:hypothetical protein
MIHDWDLVDEALIRSAAEKLRTSRKLRRRVLRASRKACRRRRWRRRIAYTAALLLPMAVFASWYQGFVDRRVNNESAVFTSASTTQRGPDGELLWSSETGSEDLMLFSKPGEWDHVETSIERRRKSSKIIRGAFF